MLRIPLRQFMDEEITFLKEYEATMTTVAQALDILQAQDSAYLGCLLPIITLTITKLTEVRDCVNAPLIYCQPLVTAMLDGINKRLVS